MSLALLIATILFAGATTYRGVGLLLGDRNAKFFEQKTFLTLAAVTIVLGIFGIFYP